MYYDCDKKMVKIKKIGKSIGNFAKNQARGFLMKSNPIVEPLISNVYKSKNRRAIKKRNKNMKKAKQMLGYNKIKK